MSINKFEIAKEYFLKSLSEIEKKNYTEAENFLLKSFELANNRPSVLSNLILVSILLEKFKNAEYYIKYSYKKIGKKIDILLQHAYLRFKQNKFIKSLIIYTFALKRYPDDDNLNFNLSVLYKNFGDYKKSIYHISKCNNLNNKKKFDNLIFYNDFVLNRDESQYSKLLQKYSDSIKEEIFTNFSIINFESQKISFVSAELKNHAVAHQIKDILKKLSDNYEIIIFNNTDKSDEITNEFKSFSKDWTDIHNLDNKELINCIQKKKSKYLFSLSGFTTNNRTEIFKSRICPVQINWCGQLTTTGLKNMDYILGDIHCTPKKFQKYYTEKILNMPEIWTNLSKIPNLNISQILPFERKNYVTFGCFGKFAKINEVILNSWSNILLHAKNSKLILISNEFQDVMFVKFVKEKILKNTIAQDRLVTYSNLNRNQVLEMYNEIDFVLDTFPYTGGTTSLEASLMEKPILTIYGETFLSRCGLSIAKNNELEKWVCSDIKEYTHKAILFSQNTKFLRHEINKLKKKRENTSLFDSMKFSNNLSKLLKEI